MHDLLASNDTRIARGTRKDFTHDFRPTDLPAVPADVLCRCLLAHLADRNPEHANALPLPIEGLVPLRTRDDEVLFGLLKTRILKVSWLTKVRLVCVKMETN